MQFVFIAVVVGTGLYFSLADVSNLSFVSSAENFKAEFLPHSTAYMWQEVFLKRSSSMVFSFQNALGNSLVDSYTCKFRLCLSHTNNAKFSCASWEYLTLRGIYSAGFGMTEICANSSLSSSEQWCDAFVCRERVWARNRHELESDILCLGAAGK